MSDTIIGNFPQPPTLLAVCSNPFCLAGIDSPGLPKKCLRCDWPIGRVPTDEDLVKLARKAVGK